MRAFRRYSRHEDAGVDMTPMLDIVFILLIFFIVTATFLDEHGIAMAEPSPMIDCNPSTALEVYVTATNQVIVDGQTFSVDTAPDRVVTMMSDNGRKAVVIRAAGEANLDNVIILRDAFNARQIDSTLKVDRG